VIVGGSLGAVQLAEHLAARGRLVALLESGDVLAPEVGWKRRSEHMHRLDRRGVTVHVASTVEEVVADGVWFTPPAGSRRHLAADAVVLAGVLEADLALRDDIVAALPGIEVTAVGDCTGLGLIRKATEEAARVAAAL
jgi:2,4-dienoyl-CoA reductase (NADPH2)